MNYTYVLLIPLIPLAVFLLLGLFNQKIKPALSGLYRGIRINTFYALLLLHGLPVFFCHR